MMRLVAFECVKTFTRWRTYIGFAAFGIIVPLVVLGLRLGGQRAFERNVLSLLQQDFLLGGNILNGWFFGFFFLGALWIHVPIVLTLVAGDQVAGEAAAGTFRFLLSRSVSRTRILAAKYVVTLLYTALTVLFIGGLTLGLSLLAFGGGDLLVIRRGILVLPEAVLPFHFFAAYGLATLAMFVVSSLCFLFSTLTDNSIGPIVATMAVIIVSLLIVNLPFDVFQPFRPYLFLYYFDAWQMVFDDPIPWDRVGRNVLVLASFALGFFLAALARFARKDILS